MIREGGPETTLRHLAESPKRLAISQFTEGAHFGDHRTEETDQDHSTNPGRKYKEILRILDGKSQGIS